VHAGQVLAEADRRDDWLIEERPAALIREVFDHRADLIPLHAGGGS
jgi:hypothetical protein